MVVLLFVLIGTLGFVLFSEHPITVGFWIILYSVFVSVCVGFDCSRYFGCLLFFVYVGALLVIFCMVVRLTPNPVFRVVPFIGLVPFCIRGRAGISVFFSSIRNRYIEFERQGSLYAGLGEYDGLGWGRMLIWLGLILLLSVISVARICKRCSGPLVRFNFKEVKS